MICLKQITQISENYFSYKTITSATYGDVSEVSLPEMTICIQKYYLLREEYKREFIEVDNTINYTKVMVNLNRPPIRDQFQYMFTKEEVFLNNCYVLKPKAYTNTNGSKDLNPYIKCEDLSPIRHSIDYIFSCFTFLSDAYEEPKPEDNFTADNNVIFQDHLVELINITVMQSIPKIDVIIHSRKEKIINKYKKTKISLYNNTINYRFILYKKSIVHSMTSPYETNCVDYQKMKHYSRYDCIGKCRIDLLVNEHKTWPGAYLTDNSSDTKNMTELFKLLLSNVTIDNEVGLKCKQKCGTNSECFAEYYDYEVIHFDYYWPKFQFFVYSPKTPDLIYRHSPKMEFEEFVCFVGSLVGLWFGFSMIMISDVLLVGVKYLQDVYRIKFTNNVVVIDSSVRTKSCPGDLGYIEHRLKPFLFDPR